MAVTFLNPFGFMTELDLLFKYNVPAPRYTSYPTVPYWADNISVPAWEQNFSRQFHSGAGELSLLSLIHI